jgi:hypothetical protein
MARKGHYTPRIAARICEHIAMGATLKDALEKEPLGPSMLIFWRWLDEYPEFSAKYEQARRLQADLLADTVQSMALAVLENPKFAPAYKVASDILKWQAEVRNPGKYGPKNTLKIETPRKSLREMRDEIKLLESELNILDIPMTRLEESEPEELE